MITPNATAAALIVAAGRGARAGSTGGPKQYRLLGSRTVLARTLAAFTEHPAVGDILVVIHPDDRALYAAATADIDPARLLPPVPGGATRQDSVHAGLAALAAHWSIGGGGPGTGQPAAARVLIHDAARPFVDRATIDRVLGALVDHPGAIAALPLTDTLKRQSAAPVPAAPVSASTIAPLPVPLISGTLDRAGLWRAQTPQGFDFAAFLAAHERAAALGRQDFTDDAALAEWAGLPVALVLGSEANSKLTTAEDLIMAERLAGCADGRPGPDDIRMATGFDVHRFQAGDHVWLCGVRIPHDASLEGHSDADVGLHALTDALLGAIADGDIGQHFPPSDPKWRGAASHLFLADAARRVASRGGAIVHCDVTLLCEAPRIAPLRDAMRARIAEILHLPLDAVSVKATTTEGLGFTGRREGIAAQAAATVRLPRVRR